MKNNLNSAIKFNIKQELKKQNKTVGKLCKEMRVNINYISQLKDRTPVNKIVDIAHAIGCEPSDLLKGL